MLERVKSYAHDISANQTGFLKLFCRELQGNNLCNLFSHANAIYGICNKQLSKTACQSKKLTLMSNVSFCCDAFRMSPVDLMYVINNNKNSLCHSFSSIYTLIYYFQPLSPPLVLSQRNKESRSPTHKELPQGKAGVIN